MNKTSRTLIAATFGAALLGAATAAFAHDHDDWGRRGHGWGHEERWRGGYYGPDVIRERVVVRRPPPVVYERDVYYGAPYYPAPYYAYPRNPAVVIGIPPIVIPLR